MKKLGLAACHIKRSEYHCGQFEGNDCRKLLKNLDKLRAICPQHMTNYAVTFERLNGVVEACYGYKLDANFVEKIKRFKTAYMRLQINVTPKVHAVFYHIEEFCTRNQFGLALGPCSEQTSESIHHDFKLTWKNFAIKDTDHPQYANQLLRAVSMYNSKHL